MPRRPREIIECRDYALPPDFPIIVLTGDVWHISDIRAHFLHFHNHLEIGVCHSGSGVLGFQDGDRPFRAGDVTAIGSGTLHTTCSSPGTSSLWSYIMADPVRLADPPVPGAPGSQLYQDLLQRGFAYNYRVTVSREEDPSFSFLAEEIIAEMQERKPNYTTCVRSLLATFMCKLSRHTADMAGLSGDNPFHIAPALRYVDTHYMDSFSIDDLAAICKMSTSYFRRVFSETMGMGPLEYVNRTRITRACAMLQMSDSSILEVCEAVGFASLSSFNRHFSSIMGQTPTVWRHQTRTDRPAMLLRYPGWVVPDDTPGQSGK